MSDATQIRSPEEVFSGDNLPDDLKWIMTHFGLPRNDPTVVLLAWHWHRVLHNQDTIHAGAMELKTVLDSRLEKIKTYSESIVSVQVGLEKLIGLLAQDDLQLKTGLFQTAQEVRIELKQLLSEIKGNWTRLLWPWCGAFFLGGFTSGIFFVLCVLYLWFLH